MIASTARAPVTGLTGAEPHVQTRGTRLAHATGSPAMAHSSVRGGRVSVSEYLAGEAAGPARHELVDGYRHAVRTPGLAHNLISGNLYLVLQERLRAGPCRTFLAEVKVRIDAAQAFLYPDLAVSCEPHDGEDGGVVRLPRLVIEVVPADAPVGDDQKRLAIYQGLPTLVEYVRVSEDEPIARAYRRTPDGEWALTCYTGDQDLELASLSVRVPLDLIYASF